MCVCKCVCLCVCVCVCIPLVLLLGQICILPGPRGPDKNNIQRALQPLVDELQMLYRGVKIKKLACYSDIILFVVLILIACDQPALRALLSFSGYTSYWACTRCDHLFTNPDKTKPAFNYFDVNCKRRTVEQHREAATRYFNANTKDEQEVIRKQTGFRFKFQT